MPKGPYRRYRNNVGELLSGPGGSSSPLARLLRRATHRDAWTTQLRALLPEEVGAKCQVANVRDHVLTVHINNAAWATRLRFLIPDLLPKLSQLADFAAVTEVRLKVEPISQSATSSQLHRDGRHVDRPNPPEHKSLTAFASELEYEQLREAFLRLASHGKMPTQTQDSEPAD